MTDNVSILDIPVQTENNESGGQTTTIGVERYFDDQESLFIDFDSLNIDDYSIYDGDYIFIPKIGGDTVYAKDLVMLDDLQIDSIPIDSSANDSGGETAIVAGFDS